MCLQSTNPVGSNPTQASKFKFYGDVVSGEAAELSTLPGGFDPRHLRQFVS
jgi:hypothetical protein